MAHLQHVELAPLAPERFEGELGPEWERFEAGSDAVVELAQEDRVGDRHVQVVRRGVGGVRVGKDGHVVVRRIALAGGVQQVRRQQEPWQRARPGPAAPPARL